VRVSLPLSSLATPWLAPSEALSRRSTGYGGRRRWPLVRRAPAASQGQAITQIESPTVEDPHPALPRPRAPTSSPESSSPRRPAAPRGHIAKPKIFLRASLQKGNSNSKVNCLFLVSCIENCRKIGKNAKPILLDPL
jgi:hypothetical protein